MFDLIAKVMETKVMRMEVTEGKKRKLGLLLRKRKEGKKGEEEASARKQIWKLIYIHRRVVKF